MRLACACGVAVVGAAMVGGCSGKASSASPDGGAISPGCSIDTLLSCGGSYVAVSCIDGVSPEEPDSGVSCSGGAEAGADTDYCCISSTPPGLGCSQDTTVQCSGGQTGYTCVSGTFPTSTATFSCSVAAGSGSGTSGQYCCSG